MPAAASGTAKQRMDFDTNAEAIFKQITDGYIKVQRSAEKAFKADPAVAKDYAGVLSALQSQRDVLKDIESTKALYEVVPKTVKKDLDITLRKIESLQKQMAKPMNVEHASKLAEEYKKTTGKIQEMQNKYGKVAEVNQKISAQLKEINKQNLALASGEAKQQLEAFANDLQLTQATLMGVGAAGLKSYDEVSKRVDDIVVGTDEIIKNTRSEADLLEDVDKAKQKALNKDKTQIKNLKKRRKAAEDLLKEENKNLKGTKRSEKDIKKLAKAAVPIPGIFERASGKMQDIKQGVKGTVAPIQGLGKAIGAPIGALAKSLTAILPALASMTAVFGIVGFAAAMVMMEKKIKEGRRAMMGLAAETGELDDQLKGAGGSAGKAGAAAVKYQQATLRYVNTLGISVDDAQAGYSDLAKAGFRLSAITQQATTQVGKHIKVTTDGFEGMYAQAVLSGKSIDEIAGMAGTLREEYAMTLDQTTKAFSKLRADAREAGLSTSRFYDKVINAAAGLGIWGAKLDDVSGSFRMLAKNIKLPEKAAAEAAARMTKHFAESTSEQQIMVSNLSGYSDKISKLMSDVAKGGKEAEVATMSLEQMGIDKQSLATLQKITDPLEMSVQAMRRIKPGEQVKATMQALSKTALGIDLSTASTDQINDAFQANTYKLEKVGEQFGLSREDIKVYQSVFEGLKENSQVKAEFANTVDPKKIEESLKTNHKELYSKFQASGEKDVKKFVNGLDTNFEQMGDLTKDIEKKKEKLEQVRQARQLRMQTQSLADALEQNVTKLLMDIFSIIEPGFNIVVKWLKFGWKILKKGFAWLLKGIGTIFGARGITELGEKMDVENKVDDAAQAVQEASDAMSKVDAKIKGTNNAIAALEKSKADPEQLKILKDQRDELMHMKNKIAASKESAQNLYDQVAEQAKTAKKGDDISSIVKMIQWNAEQAKKVEDAASKVNIDDQTKFTTEGGKPAVLVHNSPVPFTLDEPGEILSSPGTSVANSVAASAGTSAAGTGGITDSRQINIYVNHKDQKYIEQVVLNALYTDKQK